MARKKSLTVTSISASELTAAPDIPTLAHVATAVSETALASAITAVTDLTAVADAQYAETTDICAPAPELSVVTTLAPELAAVSTVTPASVAADLAVVESQAPADSGPAKGVTADNTPLSARERETLAECESQIAANLKSVFTLARAIRRVRDGRLHREQFDTFEEYCEQRWDLKRSYAYNLIDAATVYDHLYGQFDILPVNEYQARQLVQLTTDEQRQVWAEVVARADGTPITGKAVRAVVADLIPDDDDTDTSDEITCKAISETPSKSVRTMIITDILTDNAAIARAKLLEVLAHSAHTWEEDFHLFVVVRCADTRPLISLLEEYSCNIGTPLIVEQPTLRQHDWSFARSEIQILHARRGNAVVKESLSNVVVCDQNIRDDAELPFALSQLLIGSTAQRGDLIGAAGSLQSLRLAAEQLGCSVLSVREEPEESM